MTSIIQYDFYCNNCAPTWHTEYESYLDLGARENQRLYEDFIDDVNNEEIYYMDGLIAYCTKCNKDTDFTLTDTEPIPWETALYNSLRLRY